MKELPLLMSSPLVEATRRGEKTETRRLLKLPAQWSIPPARFHDGAIFRWGYGDAKESIRCRWQPGVHLWLKETHWRFGKWTRSGAIKDGRQPLRFQVGGDCEGDTIRFKEPESNETKLSGNRWHKRPSLFLPKRLARCWVVVLDVRVERLHDITPDGVLAEGVRLPATADGRRTERLTGKFIPSSYLDVKPLDATPEQWLVAHYASLWDSINGKDSWACNPFVWVLEYKLL